MESDGRVTISLENDHPKCGEIWMCNLVYKDGSVQNGYRPVFILSNNANNYHSPTLNIIPITSKMRKRKLPVHVELLEYERYGLQQPSIMLVEQVMTISKRSLDRRVGSIEDGRILSDINRAMQIQFPITQIAAAYH